MAIQADVQRNNQENPNSILRRFIKKVRTAGFTKTVRANRYYSRKPSKLRRRSSALDRLQKTEDYERLRKLGKVGTN